MSEASDPALRLATLLQQAGLPPLAPAQLAQFAAYLGLLLKWNARTNLTAIRDPEGILARHFVESIACAQLLPPGIATLLDFGSGAGFPGIPLALCRPQIAVILAESQGKKAAFLAEALRVLGLPARVHAGRAETLAATFDCVTLRAVDHMDLALRAALPLVVLSGWLAVFTTTGELRAVQSIAGPDWQWLPAHPLPGSEQRILLLGRRAA